MDNVCLYCAGLLTGSQYSTEEDIPVDNKARARRLLVVKTHAEPDVRLVILGVTEQDGKGGGGVGGGRGRRL